MDEPAGRLGGEGLERRDDVHGVRVQSDLFLGLPESRGEEIRVAGLRFASWEAELAAVLSSVVSPDDEHHPELLLRVAKHGKEDGGRP